MFSREQKEKLWQIHIYEFTSEEKNGVAIKRKLVSKGEPGEEKLSFTEEIFVVPSTYKIAENVFKQILDCGFSKIERVSPTNANCIVRVFQKLHHVYDSYTIFNMYGADVFVKNMTIWTSKYRGERFTLDYAKCSILQCLEQDVDVKFDADFVDFYIKVS